MHMRRVGGRLASHPAPVAEPPMVYDRLVYRHRLWSGSLMDQCDLHDDPVDERCANLQRPPRTLLGHCLALRHSAGIELVADFTQIGNGSGGYWEDQGYEWWPEFKALPVAGRDAPCPATDPLGAPDGR
jgi:hypothetical protein